MYMNTEKDVAIDINVVMRYVYCRLRNHSIILILAVVT